MRNADGSNFTTPPLFTYFVNFGTTLTSTPQATSIQGLGPFNFTIPPNTTLDVATVTFTVFYLSQTVTTQVPLTIVQPESIVLDFNPESYNYVYNVPNKVYF